MKQMLFILCILQACTYNVLAQGNNKEKIKQLRNKYISKNLQMDSETEREFWKIYNEYGREKQIAYRKHNIREDDPSMETIEENLERDQELLDLRKKYTQRLSRILTPQQLKDLQRSEREFKQMLIRRSQAPNPGPRYVPQSRSPRNQAPPATRPSRPSEQRSPGPSVQPHRTATPR